MVLREKFRDLYREPNWSDDFAAEEDEYFTLSSEEPVEYDDVDIEYIEKEEKYIQWLIEHQGDDKNDR